MWEDIKFRAVGLGFLVLAAAGLAIYVGLPIFRAEQHAAYVEVHPVVTIGCGPLVTLGIALLLLGRRSNLRAEETRAFTRRGAIVAVIGFAGGGVMYWWLQHQLGLLGY